MSPSGGELTKVELEEGDFDPREYSETVKLELGERIQYHVDQYGSAWPLALKTMGTSTLTLHNCQGILVAGIVPDNLIPTLTEEKKREVFVKFTQTIL
jgi:hypothetical protein